MLTIKVFKIIYNTTRNYFELKKFHSLIISYLLRNKIINNFSVLKINNRLKSSHAMYQISQKFKYLNFIKLSFNLINYLRQTIINLPLFLHNAHN